jgi:hypothetical protein
MKAGNETKKPSHPCVWRVCDVQCRYKEGTEYTERIWSRLVGILREVKRISLLQEICMNTNRKGADAVNVYK